MHANISRRRHASRDVRTQPRGSAVWPDRRADDDDDDGKMQTAPVNAQAAVVGAAAAAAAVVIVAHSPPVTESAQRLLFVYTQTHQHTIHDVKHNMLLVHASADNVFSVRVRVMCA